MDDKTNLYVFAKKEILLIFIFMIMATFLAFVAGVKVGKSFLYEVNDIKPQDRQQIEMLSPREEEIVEKSNQQKSETTIDPKTYEEQLEQKFREEFNEENRAYQEQIKDGTAEGTKDEMVDTLKNEQKPNFDDDPLVGKHTVQLGAFNTMEEASEFASGFRARGYSPIIRKVKDPNQKLWFKVSIGMFDNLSQAKDFVIKNRSLFAGEDYLFQQFE